MHRQAELLLAAGAALDDLAPDERSAYDAHRRGCPDCPMLEDELSSLLVDLSLLAPERVPPPALFAGIRLAMSGGAGVLEAPRLMPSLPAAPAIPISLERTPPRRMPVAAALGLAAVLALVAVGLGARAIGLQGALDRSTAEAASLRAALATQQGAMAALVNPAHVAVALAPEAAAPEAIASVVFVPGTTSSWLVAEHLPATPAGKAYQLWYADAAGVHPLQTVEWSGNGAMVAPIAVDLASSDAVMLTLEDASGAQGEPGPQVVFGNL
jgi:hypothetical protein